MNFQDRVQTMHQLQQQEITLRNTYNSLKLELDATVEAAELVKLDEVMLYISQEFYPTSFLLYYEYYHKLFAIKSPELPKLMLHFYSSINADKVFQDKNGFTKIQYQRAKNLSLNQENQMVVILFDIVHELTKQNPDSIKLYFTELFELRMQHRLKRLKFIQQNLNHNHLDTILLGLHRTETSDLSIAELQANNLKLQNSIQTLRYFIQQPNQYKAMLSPDYLANYKSVYTRHLDQITQSMAAL